MLEPGTQIWTFSDDRSVSGRLGLIVESADGALLGLTCREVMMNEYDPFYTDETGELAAIGERTARFCRKLGERAVSEALWAWFAVGSQVELSEDFAALFRTFVEDPRRLNLLGCTVSALLPGEPGLAARIISTSTTVSHVLGDDHRHIHGLIELRPTTNVENWFVDANAGLAVRLDDGQLLGILVGRSKESVFVAPIADLLNWEHFTLPTVERIEQHNTDLREAVYIDQADQFMSEISQNPDQWVEICAATRQPLSDFFTLQNRLFGQDRMIAIQDELATGLFYAVGARAIVENLHRLQIDNDAPGRFANENWIWRSLFERLRLIEIAPDRSVLASSEQPELQFHVTGLKGDLRNSFGSGTILSADEKDPDSLADALLGTDTHIEVAA